MPPENVVSRFVVLRHDSPRGLHWDFMLEAGGVLKTWALPEPPETPHPQTAEALPDHRLDYLDYEGPVSRGRGSVSRHDGGTYHVERQHGDELVVVLEGDKLRGRARLLRKTEPTSGASENWEFRFTAG